MWQQSAAAAQNVLRQYTLEDLINQRNAHGQAKLMFYI
jgi:DNA-binding IscR family transcriptional regulator